MHNGGIAVITWLTSVDIIIWMNHFVTHFSTQNLDGSIGYYLIWVHIGLCSWTSLPDHQREMLVKLSLDYFISSLDDCIGFI